MTSSEHEEMRVALRYQSTNVPGPAGGRAFEVANAFANMYLSRDFNYNRDFVHLPSDFDTDDERIIWILCDFNVRQPIQSPGKVPFQSLKARYENEQVSFHPYRSAPVVSHAQHYPWGGRQNEWQYRELELGGSKEDVRDEGAIQAT